MPVFFVHDVGHGIITPLNRKFRVREINAPEEVSASRALHPKNESDPDDFKHLKYLPDNHDSSQGKNDRLSAHNEQPSEPSHKAIQAYQQHSPTNTKLSLGRVKDIMSRPVISILKDQSLDSAWKLMQKHSIHHLVILDAQYQYCGLLTEKLMTPLLMKLAFNPGTGKQKTPDDIALSVFCQKNLLSTHPETEIYDLGPAMLEYGLDAVAVSDQGKIVGLLTKSDIFKVILRHQGFEEQA